MAGTYVNYGLVSLYIKQKPLQFEVEAINCSPLILAVHLQDKAQGTEADQEKRKSQQVKAGVCVWVLLSLQLALCVPEVSTLR